MPPPTPYVTFPGTAKAALEFYAGVFGGELTTHTFGEFSRTDGPPELVAHAELDGPVSLSGADAGTDGEPVRVAGLMLAVLGAAQPPTLHEWFDALAEGGTVIESLAPRPWGASDGQVVDRFGLHWLIGYQQPA